MEDPDYWPFFTSWIYNTVNASTAHTSINVCYWCKCQLMYHNPLALSVLLNEGKHSFFDNYFLAMFLSLKWMLSVIVVDNGAWTKNTQVFTLFFQMVGEWSSYIWINHAKQLLFLAFTCTVFSEFLFMDNDEW